MCRGKIVGDLDAYLLFDILFVHLILWQLVVIAAFDLILVKWTYWWWLVHIENLKHILVTPHKVENGTAIQTGIFGNDGQFLNEIRSTIRTQCALSPQEEKSLFYDLYFCFFLESYSRKDEKLLDHRNNCLCGGRSAIADTRQIILMHARAYQLN